MDYSYTIQESRYGLFTSVFADGTRAPLLSLVKLVTLLLQIYAYL